MKEPVSCGDCERVCSGGFPRNTKPEPNGTNVANENREYLCDEQTVFSSEDKEASNTDDLTQKNLQPDASPSAIREENDCSIGFNRLRSESVDKKHDESHNSEDEKADKVQEGDRKSMDEELRYPYYDDGSLKSRSMSLTSTCSLSVGMSSNDAYFIISTNVVDIDKLTFALLLYNYF